MDYLLSVYQLQGKNFDVKSRITLANVLLNMLCLLLSKPWKDKSKTAGYITI